MVSLFQAQLTVIPHPHQYIIQSRYSWNSARTNGDTIVFTAERFLILSLGSQREWNSRRVRAKLGLFVCFLTKLNLFQVSSQCLKVCLQ
jgi:hypothetical protein